MNKPHKHAEFIKAWADGATIQAMGPLDKRWLDVPCPGWYESTQYRVKPEPKKTIGYRRYISQKMGRETVFGVYTVWEGTVTAGRIAAGESPTNLLRWIDTEWQYHEL